MPPTRRRRRDPLFGWRVRRLRRQFARARLLVFVGLLLMAVPLVALPLMRIAQGEAGPQPITRIPADEPARGLIYQGLVPAKRGAPCVGAYEVGGERYCSHGPDAAPAGLDVATPVAAVAPPATPATLPTRDPAAAPAEVEVARDAGSIDPIETVPTIIADAAPDASEFTVAAGGLACDPDGRAGPRVQVLYVYETGRGSRFDEYLPSLRTWAAGVDAIVEASARETDGSRHVRFATTLITSGATTSGATTSDCQIAVAEVELPKGALSTFDRTVTALTGLGFDRTDRKYLLFAEATVYCGIATFARDSRPGPANRNNLGPSYARSDSGCWSTAVAGHELGHALGAVTDGAPHSARGGHCDDEYDLMCLPPTGSHAAGPACPDRAHDLRLDCGHDDYFDTGPAPGSYLATHWNVADSAFLVDLGGATGAAGGSGPTGTGPTLGAAVTSTTAASPSPTRAPSAAPRASTTTAAAKTPTPKTPAPTVAAPTAVPAGSAALAVGDVRSTSARLSWDAAGAGTRYAVRLGDRTLGVVGVTAVRLVGLAPAHDYTVQVTLAQPDGSQRPHTASSPLHTLAAPWPASRAWLSLANSLTGEAATVFGARSGAGAPAVLDRRLDGTHQRWLFEPLGPDTFLVKSDVGGACLAPAGGAVKAGSALVTQACDPASRAQQWRILATPHGFRLAAAGADLVVGVGQARYRGARLLVLQAPNDRRYQSWATT